MWSFPPADVEGVGPFEASPVLDINARTGNPDEQIYIGSTDGTLYVISTGNTDTCTRPPPGLTPTAGGPPTPIPMPGGAGTLTTSFTLTAQFGITSTALLAVRDGKDAIFVGGGDGLLHGLDTSGVALLTNWPFLSSGGAITASPNISVSNSVNNGIVYGGSLGGLFFGVCPNGIASFALPTAGVLSSPAVGPDGTVYFGADDGQLRSIGFTGTFNWAFSASAAIVTAPVVEMEGGTTTAIYVADTSGRILKVTSSGQRDAMFRFAGPTGGTVGAIRSSPALWETRLYFGSEDGNVYAVDKDSGEVIWTVETDGAVESSPAVAAEPGGLPVVIVGSNDGKVYFIGDDGTPTPRTQTFSIGAAVRSSPAIDKCGTVYVGADDGRVYAIGAPTPGS